MISSLHEALRQKHRGYSGARPDVVRLVPHGAVRVLDVGCGAGMTAELLHLRDPRIFVVGVEPDVVLAQVAADRVDSMIIGEIGDPATRIQVESLAPFDVILLADVLEHTVDPSRILQGMCSLLGPEGSIITSVPNVRHLSTFIALGVFGEWPLRDRGIHDRTHLRWFTRRSILEMGKAAGLEASKELRNLRLVESLAWTMIPARLFDFWPFRPFLTFQYLHLWSLGAHAKKPQ